MRVSCNLQPFHSGSKVFKIEMNLIEQLLFHKNPLLSKERFIRLQTVLIFSSRNNSKTVKLATSRA